MNHKRLYVIIGIDVEEEGLFSGSYKAKKVEVSNVALLRKLEPLHHDFGLPLTLFCTYSVFNNTNAQETLAWMHEHCKSEIGAHLHHWSTPPFDDYPDENVPPQRTHKLPSDLLEARLLTLLEKGAEFTGKPLTSFRMGRWDLKSRLLPILAAQGIKVDSSVCPLRAFTKGPNHFMAPGDPYCVKLYENTFIIEAPITQIPLTRLLAKVWYKLSGDTRLDYFHYFGALSANPLWHTDAVMRLATRLHVSRGGQVLNIFWHSSEMLPQGSPHIPDQKAADTLLKRIFSFCTWLRKNYDVMGITASGLIPMAAEKLFDIMPLSSARDW